MNVGTTLMNPLTKRLLVFASLLLAVASGASSAFAGDFKKDVVYMIMVDRFYDGDAANNNPPQSSGLYDPTRTQWHAYWGGDLAGVQQKMQYLADLGVTAIWISPPVDNENLNDNTPTDISAPFHGYQAHDFKRIEEHIGDAVNSWAAFDNLVAAAHAKGIKVVVDFAMNHTNDNNHAEYGALYDNGVFMGNYVNDLSGYFHHTLQISDYGNRYQVQYYSLSVLSDLNQENPTIDRYLKDAANQFLQHGVDGFRLDAIKHVTWGWSYSFANSVFTNGTRAASLDGDNVFLFGEWIAGTGDALYHDLYKFTNRSGIAALDFPLVGAIDNVFANDHAFSEIDSTLNNEAARFASPNDLVTFIDNHDRQRFLSINNNPDRLHEALAFLLTSRGIPVIYYGTEQYLHNDTNGGNDPYNRPQMTSFDETTPAFQLIQQLSALRRTNPAIPYGTQVQRWISSDVYMYERAFAGNVVLVAINKNDTTPMSLSGGHTALPPGTYADYLGGAFGGVPITITDGAGYNPFAAVTLPPHSIAVWSYTASAASGPSIAAIDPNVVQPGVNVAIPGVGFDATTTVSFGGTPAAIVSSSPTDLVVTVPQLPNGNYSVTVTDGQNRISNAQPFTVLAAPLVPVTFTLNGAPALASSENYFVTGSTVELGNWSTTWDGAVGPMLIPPSPQSPFLCVSVPAGQSIQFKFIKLAADGTVTWESGSNHTYAVPASGASNAVYAWGIGPQQVAAPTFTPGGGIYTSEKTVTIATATPGATIRYTTDGSTPSQTNGTFYTGPVTISAATTATIPLQAIAYETGFTDSPVTSANYTISAGPPINLEAEAMSPSATGATTANVSDALASGGALTFLYASGPGPSIDFTTPTIAAGSYQLQFRYKTSTARPQFTTQVDGTPVGGMTDEYASGSAQYPTVAIGSVAFGTSGSHHIKLTITGKNATSTGYTLSADAFILVPQFPVVAAPTFSLPSGIYVGTQTVAIASATNGASIRYTTDGSIPTSVNGALYQGPIAVAGPNATLRAVAFASGYNDSGVSSATYTIGTGAPILLEAESMPYVGTGTTTATVADTSASGGAIVFLYGTSTGPTIDFPTPSIPAGTYQLQFRYKTSTARPQFTTQIDGVAIGGTIDEYATGATQYPTVVIGTVIFPSTGTHTIRLTIAGKNAASTNYTLSTDLFTLVPEFPTAATPTFSPGAGSFVGTQTIAIASATPGALIRYTVDGSVPTSTVGTVYPDPVTVSTSTTLQAIAYAPGYLDSTVAAADYTILPPAAPSALTATAGDGQVTLGWSASAGADTYNVKRSTTPGGPYAIIAAGVTGTSYGDSSVVNGTTYSYVVSAVNGGGESPNSNEVSARPAAPPTLLTPPADQTATVGDTVTFNVAVGGTPPFTYQWLKDDANIVGATSDSLTLANVRTAAAGNYAVVVTNAAGTVTSSAAKLTVNKATAQITLANLTQSYDGQPKQVSVTTTPATLAAIVTYNGTATLPTAVGDYAVVATVDDVDYQGTATATLRIVDTTPPSIRRLSASPATLWPVNHKFVAVTIAADVTDDVDPAPDVRIASIACNESPKLPAWNVTGKMTAELMADRDGTGTGRVYTLTIAATDAAGNTSTGTVTVSLPHDKGK